MQMFIAIVLYVFALCVTAYDKYCLVLDHFEKPRFYGHPVLLPVFFAIRLGLWVIACVLFYLTCGLWIALAGVVFYLAFGTVLLRLFYRKRVTLWVPVCMQIIRKEQSKGESCLSEAEMMKEALKRAEFAVKKAIKA
jgi:hypothetical protein